MPSNLEGLEFLNEILFDFIHKKNTVHLFLMEFLEYHSVFFPLYLEVVSKCGHLQFNIKSLKKKFTQKWTFSHCLLITHADGKLGEVFPSTTEVDRET